MEVGHGGDGKESSLIDALRGSLQQLAADIASDDVDVDRANDVIVSVGACLQNFPFGRDALAEEIHAFIPLLPVLLCRFWTAIRSVPAVPCHHLLPVLIIIILYIPA